MIGALLTAALLVALMYVVFAIRRITNETIVPEVRYADRQARRRDGQYPRDHHQYQRYHRVGRHHHQLCRREVVSPVIRVSGLLAGVRTAATYLARRGEK